MHSEGLAQTLQKLGYSELNPLQKKAVAEGFLESARTLVSAPTASGKTLLALLAIARHFESSRTGVFYVVPLRALASEKYKEFKKALSSFGLTVGISTGDFDSNSPNLREYDVVLATSEKLDSLLRHDRSWLERIGLVVLDEVHLIGDGSRGATLEVVLTKLKNAGTKILALSATIPNDKEFAEWLSAKLVQSDYRPTPLMMGLCDGKTLYLEDESVQPLKGLAAKALCEKALAEKGGKGQGLFFVSTRRFTESLARQLAPTAALFLTAEEKAQCAVLAQRALKTFATPTAQCKALAECLQNGVAFHHAGLPQKQKDLIEDGFKDHRCIKAIAATTTLAAGLDMPASWVVVRDTKRFNGQYSEHIPKIECMQMCLPGKAKILMESGSYKRIDEVVRKKSSEKVITVNEKTGKTQPKSIVNWIERHANAIKTIQLEGGAEIDLTPNHPLWVSHNRMEPSWNKASEVNVGDLVATVYQTPPVTGKIRMLDYVEKKYAANSQELVKKLIAKSGATYGKNAEKLGVKVKTLKEYAYKKSIPIHLIRKLAESVKMQNELYAEVKEFKSKTGKTMKNTNEFPNGFFWLVGLFAAEARVVNYIGKGRWKNVRYQKVKFTNTNKKIFEKVEGLLNQLGIHFSRRKATSGFDKNRKIDSIEICNQAFSGILNKFGLYGGRKTHSLCAPENVFELPDELLSQYLGGLFDGDGSIDRKKQVLRLCLKSKQMIFDSKKLLARFGIRSQAYPDKHGSWWLAVSSINDINRFKQKIPTVRIRVKERTIIRNTKPKKFFGEVVFEKVKRVTERKNGAEKVYNLTIEMNSNYICEGILVHNCGRAGRPRFDKKGTAVIMCQPHEIGAVRDKYVLGDLENIYSQLSAEPSLRSHALGLLASGYAHSFQELFAFFSSTFYAHQYGDAQQLLSGVEKVVGQLSAMDFVREKKGRLLATPAGKRVAELYVDPYSAHHFMQTMDKKLTPFAFLMALTHATESRPLVRPKRDEERILWEEWFALLPDETDDEEALSRFKTAKLLNAWVNEATEDSLLKDFDIPPGVVHAKVRIQEWLAYAYAELAYLLNQSTALGAAKAMRRRLKHGVKAELLPLVSLRGVGRVRARRLYNKGVRSKEAAEALTDEQRKALYREG